MQRGAIQYSAKARHWRLLLSMQRWCSFQVHIKPAQPPYAFNIARIARNVVDESISTHGAGVVQEGAVEGAADGFVAAEAEGDVGHAAANLAARTQPLDLPRRPANMLRVFSPDQDDTEQQF